MGDKPKKKGIGRSTRLGLVLASFVIAALDYQSKRSIEAAVNASEGSVIELLPFLNFVSVHNTGIAFGMLATRMGFDVQSYVVGISLGFCFAIYGFLSYYPRINLTMALVAAMMLGGGIGNTIDRIMFNKVYDFIDFHVAGWHFPAFNLADVSISLAVIILLFDTFFGPKKPPATEQIVPAEPESEQEQVQEQEQRKLD